MKSKLKKRLTPILLVILLLVVAVAFGVTYALFSYYKEGKVESNVETAKITFRYDETSVKGIDLKKAYPMWDYEGSKLAEEGEIFDFIVSTEGTDALLYYTISLEATEDSTLNPDALRVYLTSIHDGIETSSCVENGKLKRGVGTIGEGYFQANSEP